MQVILAATRILADTLHAFLALIDRVAAALFCQQAETILTLIGLVGLLNAIITMRATYSWPWFRRHGFTRSAFSVFANSLLAILLLLVLLDGIGLLGKSVPLSLQIALPAFIAVAAIFLVWTVIRDRRTYEGQALLQRVAIPLVSPFLPFVGHYTEIVRMAKPFIG